jgi:nucleotide-binding universal stress UspA family protein
MYKKIALAIAFSPRMETLITDAKKLVNYFQSEFILIHVGIKTLEIEKRLNVILSELEVDTSKTKVLWKEKGKPARKIIEACKEENVDLLIAGALKHEGFFTYYLGSVARKIIRKAPCSVMTLIEPIKKSNDFSKVVINGTQLEITPEVIRQGVDFSKQVSANHVYILNEIKMYGLLMGTASEDTENKASVTRRKLVRDEIAYVEENLKGIDVGDLKISIKVTGGRWATELARFCEKKDADLLIVGDDRSLTFFDRLFPHDLEDLLSTLPCNLLIIKK